MNEIQKDLLNYTKKELKIAKSEYTFEQYKKIRGVIALWNELEETACITFYFDGETTEEDEKMAFDISIYIMADLIKGMLEKKYIRLDYPIPLPESPYWSYKRPEEQAV